MKKRFFLFLMLIAALSVFLFNSCQDFYDVHQEDFKEQLDPVSSSKLPVAVQNQIERANRNLNTYIQDKLCIEDVNVLGKLATGKSVNLSLEKIADQSNFIAYGNIRAPQSVITGKIEELYENTKSAEIKNSIMDSASREIKKGDIVLEITWRNGDNAFTSLCFCNDSGIVWDNILSGLIMIDSEEQINDSVDRGTSWKSYRKWWTASWLWGSKRGEMGYEIKIYYSGSTVTNTDVEDWGYITLGSAKSYSKVIKNSGSYGKCQYALGMCTPLGSLSFDYSNFKVSFSGLGSNIVANGTKSLYP